MRRRRRKKQRKSGRFLKIIGVILITALAVSAFLLAKNIAKTLFSSGGDIPSLLQTDPRWGEEPYGNSTVAHSGCGPTCLSMAYIGLTGDDTMTPGAMSRFAEENGYYVEGTGTSWDLMTSGAERLGLHVKELSLDEGTIKRELNKNHPIICSVGPGDFTYEGHFIVLVEYTEDGMIRVNDPNSVERSEELWYYTTLAPQINALWAYSK